MKPKQLPLPLFYPVAYQQNLNYQLGCHHVIKCLPHEAEIVLNHYCLMMIVIVTIMTLLLIAIVIINYGCSITIAIINEASLCAFFSFYFLYGGQIKSY